MIRRAMRCFRAVAVYLRACMRGVSSSKRIFLMCTPWHGNLGDQAIVLAEYQILKKVFPDYAIIEYPSYVLRTILMRFDRRISVDDNDIIVIHGGGNFGSLYADEEEVHRWIVGNYLKKKIFFMQD